MGNNEYELIETECQSKNDIVWLEDSLDYETETDLAFNVLGYENGSSISSRDKSDNSIEVFKQITGYEGEVIGIDNFGRVIGYDGIEFVKYEPTKGYKPSDRTEREWGVSDPIAEFVEDYAEYGPWITLTEKLESSNKEQSNPDLTENTIIDSHAASRWDSRSNHHHSDIISEMEGSEIYSVGDDQHLGYLDFVRQNERTGLIFPQKANRIITTMPPLERFDDNILRQSYRNVLNKSGNKF